MADSTLSSRLASSGEQPPGLLLYHLLKGMWIARAITCAAQLRLADALSGTEKSSTELAQMANAYEPFLLRLLRALASIDIFREVSAGVFANTDLSSSLRSDVGDMYDMACLMGSQREWETWLALEGTVRTGVPAMERLYRTTFWRYLEDHPEEGRSFHAAMTNVAEKGNSAIAAALDTAGISTIMDVGGGEGSLLIALLRRNPHLKGVLFDQPSVIEQARSRLAGSGFEDRIELLAGDVMHRIPAGADAYILKHLLHGCSDSESHTMLKQCLTALAGSTSRLLVIEQVLLPGKQSVLGKFLDLQMMLQDA